MEETLKLILTEIKGVKEDITSVKRDVAALKGDVSALKRDVAALKADSTALKEDVAAVKGDIIALKQDSKVLKDGQGRIEEKVVSLSSELRSKFNYTNGKLDEHREVFGVVSGELRGIKVDVDYLSAKTGKHDTELNNLINRLRG